MFPSHLVDPQDKRTERAIEEDDLRANPGEGAKAQMRPKSQKQCGNRSSNPESDAVMARVCQRCQKRKEV